MAKLGKAGRPDLNIYIYETWHSTKDREGWVDRIEVDLERYWEAEILIPAVRGAGFSIYKIPGGHTGFGGTGCSRSWGVGATVAPTFAPLRLTDPKTTSILVSLELRGRGHALSCSLPS